MARIGNLFLEPVSSSTDSHLPRFAVHRVDKGESLWQISQGHGLDYQSLLETNLVHNLATLKRHNGDIVYRLAHREGTLQDVKITLQPGDLTLTHLAQLRGSDGNKSRG